MYIILIFFHPTSFKERVRTSLRREGGGGEEVRNELSSSPSSSKTKMMRVDTTAQQIAMCLPPSSFKPPSRSDTATHGRNSKQQ
jgi:hypothetical protein